ncbi:DUF4235 domain-containing protein [Cellulomonas terrae]|uniref:DUF4235 domain-containing protein n=1 Tax=Cellulomonas terrae TaxID=311234 RepID=A0A511JMH1_9CELL|nr:DUF4235 domain-containing protein [Cellulomonas terrae]GEL99227.1 hypothetical protein CTE05_27740 [Cellulomonas terrae]
MDEKQTQSVVAKLIGAGVALGAAVIVQKILSRAWEAKTGHAPPAADDQGDAPLAEIVAAAALTGALVAISRVLATRGTARFTAKL